MRRLNPGILCSDCKCCEAVAMLLKKPLCRACRFGFPLCAKKQAARYASLQEDPLNASRKRPHAQKLAPQTSHPSVTESLRISSEIPTKVSMRVRKRKYKKRKASKRKGRNLIAENCQRNRKKVVLIWTDSEIASSILQVILRAYRYRIVVMKTEEDIWKCASNAHACVLVGRSQEEVRVIEDRLRREFGCSCAIVGTIGHPPEGTGIAQLLAQVRIAISKKRRRRAPNPNSRGEKRKQPQSRTSAAGDAQICARKGGSRP